MEGKMILSKSALLQGFNNDNDKQNVGIHEFIHLVDKQDGATDGVPTMLLQHKLIGEWLGVIHEEIELIFKNRSDINPYATTNNAEFLAVTGEYFFESPELMKKKHPKLYADMCEIFHQAPSLRTAKNMH
jgi:Mlc titration factor MtfA (ptsG expression regulator)